MAERVDTLVAGGGPAGLMAALAAARRGASVVVADRNPEPGRKILAAGNGRCNLTNQRVGPEDYLHTDLDFVAQVLRGRGPAWLRGFLRDLGLETRAEGRRVYPAPGEAAAVRDRLLAACRETGVTLRRRCEVVSAVSRPGGFRVGVSGEGEEGTLECRRLVIACGGRGYPGLGGTEAGYRLCRSLGHSLTPLVPGLVPLRTKVALHHRLQGVKVDAAVRILAGKGAAAETRGDVLFTDYGLSGQAILDVSLLAAPLLAEKRRTFRIEINFFPGTTAAALEGRLLKRWARRPGDSLLFDIEGLLPRKIGPVLARAAGLLGKEREGPRTGALDGRAASALSAAATAFTVTVTGTLSWPRSMVTVGGVPTAEVDPRNLESRLVPGLHLAGELLDVQGRSGGFNLHWAFASGHRAGS